MFMRNKDITLFLKTKKYWLLAGAVLIPMVVLATDPVGRVFNVDLNRGTAREPISALGNVGNWHFSLQTDQPSDVIVVDSELFPHGFSGWHSHPGPVLITVKKGTATWYHAATGCNPVVYPTGSAFVEPAGLPHSVQNESDTEDMELLSTYILPVGADRRTDEPNPGTCSSVQ
jgi:quercetin dioxygenase-like cupin family protein